MKVIADFCIIPMGVGVSVSEYVAVCQDIFEKNGLKPELHAYGTNVEGEWDNIFIAAKQCHEKIHEMGAPRITTTLKFGTRVDREQTMDDKIRSVREKMS